ncbi:uncharacterized protein LOC122814881 [Protopterus annectens]|uniref:uncharacterized protein LOC122814881 n=1 Tax=Protopterus annectens TaxID=7888 RepID=UPI001CFBC5E0|nr:uncharacterized protein LOC122814881 [Protopterus annectens]
MGTTSRKSDEYKKGVPEQQKNLVLNLSKFLLNDHHLSVLCKGLSFIPTSYSCYAEVILDIKMFARNLNLKLLYKDNADANSKCVGFSKPSSFIPNSNVLVNAFEKLCIRDIYEANVKQGFKPHNNLKQNMTRQEREALLELERNEQIIVRPADKGGLIVVLDRDSYKNSISASLKNDSSYEIIGVEQVSGYISRVRMVLEGLFTNGMIDEKLLEYFLVHKPIIPILQGLPKVHKSVVNPPMRAIVSSRGWCTEPVSIFVEKHLRPVLDSNKYILKDTEHFLRDLYEFIEEYDSNIMFVTLDVVSLFTVIPNVVGLAAVKDFLEKYTEYTPEKIQMCNFTNIKNISTSEAFLNITTNWTVVCNSGYEPLVTHIHCKRNANGRAEWSTTDACGEMCTFTNITNISTSEAFLNITTNWTVVCNSGYEPLVTHIHCKRNANGRAEWSTTDACGEMCSFTNIMNISTNETFLHTKTDWTVVCNSGYEPLVTYIRCERNKTGKAQWSTTNACGEMCSFTNIMNISTNGTFLHTKTNWTVVCNSGYEPLVTHIRCERNKTGKAQWSTTNACGEMCSFTHIKNINTNETFLSTTRNWTVECNSGYEPLVNYMYCKRNKSGSAEWNITNACGEMCNFTKIKNINTSEAFLNTTTNWTVVCNSGYEPLLTHINCKRNANGTAEWNTTDACGEMCSFTHIKNINTNETFLRTSTNWTVECNSGYEPLVNYIYCKRNESGSAEWNITNACGEMCHFTDINNIIINESFLNTTTNWTVVCSVGFEPLVTYIYCKRNDSGRAEWSTKDACGEMCNFTHIKNINTSETFLNTSMNWTVVCNSGYEPLVTHIHCIRNEFGRADWNTSIPCAEKPQLNITGITITHSSIIVSWYSTNPVTGPIHVRIKAVCQFVKTRGQNCERKNSESEQSMPSSNNTLIWSSLQPFSTYNISFYGEFFMNSSGTPLQNTILESQLIDTNETSPKSPRKFTVDTISRKIQWEKLSDCEGTIIAYQLFINGTREYNNTFQHTYVTNVTANVTEYTLQEEFRNGTDYQITIRGFTSEGTGNASRMEIEINITEPEPPNINQVFNISTTNASIQLEPGSDKNGPVPSHQIIILNTTLNATETKLGEICRYSDLLSCNISNIGHGICIAAEIPANLTDRLVFRIGDNEIYDGYQNVPLSPGKNYTVIVRRASKRKTTTTYSCAHFSFATNKMEDTSTLTLIHMILLAIFFVLVFLLLVIAIIICRRKSKNEHIKLNGYYIIPMHRIAHSKTKIPVKKFLSYMIMLKKLEIKKRDYDEDVGLVKEYKKLRPGLQYPCEIAKQPWNAKKNRYKNILPYDHSLVVLNLSRTDSTDNYINANYIDGYECANYYIAAQGPLPETVNNFWRMVWDENSAVIVMLTNLIEQEKVKCEQYWPQQSKAYDEITVVLTGEKQCTEVTMRTFTLTRADSPIEKIVKQFHYLTWPDHGVPSCPISLYHLVLQVNECKNNRSGPVIVHCSAGVGRTGTFIALDYLLKMATCEGKLDIFQCSSKLRERRTDMIQTKEQYLFLYECLLEALICGDTRVPVQNIHSNEKQTSPQDSQKKFEKYAYEFQTLKTFSEIYKLHDYSSALKPENKPKNRDLQILPDSLVCPALISITNPDKSPGYINAVFADTYLKRDGFLITQLPLKNTIIDFWALVYDYNSASVVMMTQTSDLDESCPKFWPSSEKHLTLGPFKLELESEEQAPGVLNLRVLKLTHTEQKTSATRQIKFWQLENWPLKEPFPQSSPVVISLLGELERWQQKTQNMPIVVTCPDGASQSGLFCALSFVCEQIKAEGQVDVLQAVKRLRKSRHQFIKDEQQYLFCYHLASDFLDLFDTYGNFQ